MEMGENDQLGNKEFRPQSDHNKKKQRGWHNTLPEAESMTLAELRRFALLKFGSFSQFARAIGSDRSRARKILEGEYMPKRDATIEKIARAIGLPIPLITKLFKSLESRKCENCGCELASDEEGWCDSCNLPESSPIQ